MNTFLYAEKYDDEDIDPLISDSDIIYNDLPPDITRLINTLTRNLTSYESLMIQKYYIIRRIRRSSIKFGVQVILQMLLDNKILLTDIGINHIFDTIKIKPSWIREIYIKNSSIEYYIGGWVSLIKSYLTNKEKYKLIENLGKFKTNTGILESDLWNQKLFPLYHLFNSLAQNLMLLNIKNSIIKTTSILSKQVDNAMILIICLLHYCNIDTNLFKKPHDEYKESLNPFLFKSKSLNLQILNSRNMLKRYFIIQSGNIGLEFLESNKIYYTIFFLILRSLPKKMIRQKTMVELMKIIKE